MTGADPNYDLIAAFDTLAPGLVLQRPILDGLADAYAAGGFRPLTQSQVLAVTGPLPVFPVKLQRFADSNPDALDGARSTSRAGPLPGVAG